jgi:hypothetical protein
MCIFCTLFTSFMSYLIVGSTLWPYLFREMADEADVGCGVKGGEATLAGGAAMALVAQDVIVGLAVEPLVEAEGVRAIAG